MTWFPEMISFIRYHIDACPICMTSCRKDLEHYAAEATAQQNLYLGEVTPFEKALGEPPRTVQDMAFIPNMPRTMTPTDAALLQQVRMTTAETIALSHEKRAETVRRNLLAADVTSHASKTRVSDIRVGDDVSYKGKPYKVIQIDSHGPAGASKVKIEHSDVPLTPLTPMPSLVWLSRPQSSCSPAITHYASMILLSLKQMVLFEVV